MHNIQIASKKIGIGHSVFIIAEVGANFEHSFDKACEMIESAARCGVDAVKFQTYNPETNVTKTAPKFWDIEGTGSTQYEEQKDGLILDEGQYLRLREIAEKCGIIFFSSVCDEEGVDMLERIGVPAYKLASMEISNLPFLQYVASKGKPVLLSTGASEEKEVKEAVEAFFAEGNRDLILLHCVSNYPTSTANVNLARMATLQKLFPDVPIGYSDHTLCSETLPVLAGAVALGARVLEKHFTFDSARPGYDHEISADYPLMKNIVAAVRIVEKSIGDPRIFPLASEDRVRLYGRRGVVSRMTIPAGTVIRREHLIIKRPATGIQPKELNDLLGRKTKVKINEDEVITWGMIASP